MTLTLDQPSVALALFAHVRYGGARSVDEMEFIVCAAARNVLGDETALPTNSEQICRMYRFVNDVLADIRRFTFCPM